jgi:hypothetical protein
MGENEIFSEKGVENGGYPWYDVSVNLKKVLRGGV